MSSIRARREASLALNRHPWRVELSVAVALDLNYSVEFAEGNREHQVTMTSFTGVPTRVLREVSGRMYALARRRLNV